MNVSDHVTHKYLSAPVLIGIDWQNAIFHKLNLSRAKIKVHVIIICVVILLTIVLLH